MGISETRNINTLERKQNLAIPTTKAAHRSLYECSSTLARSIMIFLTSKNIHRIIEKIAKKETKGR